MGGNHSGVLSVEIEDVLMRSATVVSSLATGVVFGVICGLIAQGIQAVAAARRGGSPPAPQEGLSSCDRFFRGWMVAG